MQLRVAAGPNSKSGAVQNSAPEPDKRRYQQTKDKLKADISQLKKNYSDLAALVVADSKEVKSYLTAMESSSSLLKNVNKRVAMGKAIANASRPQPRSLTWHQFLSSTRVLMCASVCSRHAYI